MFDTVSKKQQNKLWKKHYDSSKSSKIISSYFENKFGTTVSLDTWSEIILNLFKAETVNEILSFFIPMPVYMKQQ